MANGDAGEPPEAYGDGIVNAVTPNVAKLGLCRNDKNRFFKKAVRKGFLEKSLGKNFVSFSKASPFH